MPSFVLPGKPFAWRRARSNGRVRFKDRATEAHEQSVQAIALPLFPRPMEGPISLHVTAFFKVPDSWSKVRKAQALGRPHTQRPDCDNLAKQIGDALNRIAWADDSQVAVLMVCKVWADRDETVVRVEPAQ